MGFFDRLKEGLEKTRKNLVERASALFSKPIDNATLEELEEILIMADVGPAASTDIIEAIRKKAKKGEVTDMREALKAEMSALISEGARSLSTTGKPSIIMVVGVNGVGKTTSIGKIGKHFHDQGLNVVMAAGDTFRAAAIEQLEIWAKRAEAHLVKHQDGSDPAAVAYDAVASAVARKADVVIIDTAGRLHNKAHLMDELKKIHRVIGKAMPGAPHEVLLVLDATTGQNALQQAKVFNEIVGLTGIVLTKLDGSAKGGIVFAIKKELGLPVRLIGVGEGIEDLQDFKPDEFVEALFQN
ncbi:MAG: signal recognition particle-docking protein FtsY [Nitrospirae bacterium]|nr:signal recognition particle-docking protein FtsY [Nitrospirota bacterium]